MMTTLTVLMTALTPPPALAGDAPEAPEFATVGELAPPFTLRDLDNKEVKLEDFEGQVVVLEWFNPDCPFVKFAHGETEPLRELPTRLTDDGAVWLAINSGAHGKQGNGLQRNREALEEYAIDYPVLLDESGAVGRRYQATSTPHIYIIDEEGTLVYRGALDSTPMGRGNGAPLDHALDAFESVKADKPVPTPETRPYGCNIKYGS